MRLCISYMLSNFYPVKGKLVVFDHVQMYEVKVELNINQVDNVSLKWHKNYVRL